MAFSSEAAFVQRFLDAVEALASASDQMAEVVTRCNQAGWEAWLTEYFASGSCRLTNVEMTDLLWHFNAVLNAGSTDSKRTLQRARGR
jgi:hypothetical protein